MLDFLDTTLFEYGRYDEKVFTVAVLIKISIIILASIFLYKYAKSLIKRRLTKSTEDIANVNSFFKSLNYVLWIIPFFLILSLLQFNLSDFELFTFGDQNTKSVTAKTFFLIFITIVISILIVKVLRLVTKKYMDRSPDSQGRVDSFIQIQKYIIYFIAFLVCLKIFKVNLSNILFSASAALVVLSLGLQSLFADFISGIIILFDGTIKSNDIIEVGDTIGKVKKITLRNSTLITRDDYVIIMPNKKFITENVTNWSHHNNIMRFSVNVGVAYGSDTKLISKLLMNCLEEHSLISKQRKGFVAFKDFGDSALVFELYFWTTEIFRIEILKSDLRFMIDKTFRENNITIPFPQRDVHLFNSSPDKKNLESENNSQ